MEQSGVSRHYLPFGRRYRSSQLDDLGREKLTGYWGIENFYPVGFYAEHPSWEMPNLVYSEWSARYDTAMHRLGVSKLAEAKAMHVFKGDTFFFAHRPTREEVGQFLDQIDGTVVTGFGNWIYKWLWPFEKPLPILLNAHPSFST
ncbi:MAG: hypothetical protein ACFB10_22525 [Salibacteraceae bacterium]